MFIFLSVLLAVGYSSFIVSIGLTITTPPFWIGMALIPFIQLTLFNLYRVPQVSYQVSPWHERNIRGYHNHKLLVNYKHDQIAFKFMGHQYHTSKFRSRAYSFDHEFWLAVDTKPFERLRLVLSGRARKATFRKKAFRYGLCHKFL
jgi:hypothetical protein